MNELTENDVVGRVCEWLERNGWSIDSRATTSQTGIDIEAHRGADRLVIEAKGATSSQSTSARFGKGFSRNQIRSHVSRAFYTAAAQSTEADRWSAIALPETADHQHFVEQVSTPMRRLGIGLFWVNDREVRAELPWASD